MRDELICEYRGYRIVWGFDNTRPPMTKFLPTVLHPTESGRSMVAKTVKGAKAIVDAVVSGAVRF